jgi:hypothetical protein
MDLHQALLGAAVEVIADDEDRQGIAADWAAEEQAQGPVFSPLDLCRVPRAGGGDVAGLRWSSFRCRLTALVQGPWELADALVELARQQSQKRPEPATARFA